MTLKEAQKEAQTLGYTLKHDADYREYRVAQKLQSGASPAMREAVENGAYYTDDLDDAVNTLRTMAKQQHGTG